MGAPDPAVKFKRCRIVSMAEEFGAARFLRLSEVAGDKDAEETVSNGTMIRIAKAMRILTRSKWACVWEKLEDGVRLGLMSSP